MNRPGGVARNLAWLVFGDAAARLGLFVFTLLTARLLGPDDFGVFALAQGSVLYVWIAVDLGVNLYGAREVARAGASWSTVAGELLGLRLTASLVMGTVFAAGSWLLAPERAQGALVAGALYLVVNGLNLDWAAKGLERFDLTAFGSAATALSVLTGFALVLRATPAPAVAVLVWGAAYLAGVLVLHLGIARVGGRVKPRFDPVAWRRHLSASLLFATSGALLSAIQYAPVLALTVWGDFFDLGQFAASARVTTLLMSAGFLLPMAMFPRASRLAGTGSRLATLSSRLRWIMLAGGVVTMALTAVLADAIIVRLYGTSYGDAVRYLRTLTLVLPLVFVRYSVGSLLLAAGRQVRHSLSSLAGLTTTAVGLLVLVPSRGVWGACVAWILGEAVVALSMVVAWEMHARAPA